MLLLPGAFKVRTQSGLRKLICPHAHIGVRCICCHTVAGAGSLSLGYSVSCKARQFSKEVVRDL